MYACMHACILPVRRYVEAQRRVPPLGKKENNFCWRKKYDKFFFLQTGSLNRSKLVLAMLNHSAELTSHMELNSDHTIILILDHSTVIRRLTIFPNL